ncbi:MAG: hypothetical protein HC842_07510, partial [Cytophagales bacterium]|nr:hypothetical protein [Cytophagales bacterium]
HLAVSDSGPGIAEHLQSLVFEDFVQLEVEGKSKSEGSGLGLPLAKRLAELHAGRLVLESAPGQGSRFILSLPAEASRFTDAQRPQPKPLTAAPAMPPENMPGTLLLDNEALILVVEDHSDLREYIIQVLGKNTRCCLLARARGTSPGPGAPARPGG